MQRHLKSEALKLCVKKMNEQQIVIGQVFVNFVLEDYEAAEWMNNGTRFQNAAFTVCGINDDNVLTSDLP